MTLQKCIKLFLNGFKDSLYGCVIFFRRQKLLNQKSDSKNSNDKNNKNEKLYKRLFESCILNGVFLLACMIAFNFILMPILNWVYFKMLTPEKHNIIIDYINPFLQLVFSFVWILPVFLLSKVCNLLWHQDIADIAFDQKYSNFKLLNQQNLTFSLLIADIIFSSIMQFVFLIQSSFMNFIPITWLSQLLCHVHIAFLYSLYAFEYKWFNMKWDILKRIDFIETRWPYFFGFGLSLSVILSFFSSYIYCATIFAFIFPAFIISAIESDCEKIDQIVYNKIDPNSRSGPTSVNLRLPLFQFSLKATDYIFINFEKVKKQKIKKTTSNQHQATFTKTN